MAELKPAYLIHGDDHGAVAERRARLRALVEAPGESAASVEVLDGEAATPAGVALALAAMTLTTGRRVIIVEGVERWKDAEIEQQLAPALGGIAPDTTLALFAREEPRKQASPALHAAVKKAGGQVVAQMNVKPWELPKWVREQGARLGLSLDGPAAKALVAQVGTRQQRLLRELETLALDLGAVAGPDTGAGRGTAMQVDAELIDERAASSAEQRAFTLADALVGGDAGEATHVYLRLREQGERLSGLIYLMAQRMREALLVAERLAGGESAASVKRGLRMPKSAAERFVADVAKSDPQRLRDGLAVIADLELDSRGGAVVSSDRAPLVGMSEDTLAVRAIAAICD